MATYDEWFLGIVAYYRPLGFFVSPPFAGLSDLQCQRLIEQKHPNWFADQFLNPRVTGNSLKSLEDFIVQMDRSRVWTTDQEGVYESCGFYAQSIKSLAAIARGAFKPQDVSETWEEADGREFVIRVGFELAGTPMHLWINRCGDFANSGWIDMVNQVCGYRDPRFRLYPDSQDWRVIFQTDGDAAAMATRHWPTSNFDSISGIISYPPSDGAILRYKRDRWLYWHRGVFRYRIGDVAGAWDDWLLAEKLGFPDLYRRCDELTRDNGA
ncbi:hypothetical protein [Humisphaera borealis]|uniref:Uncharacterized protein n=1 Tax=Humisphaera borealis TaxID=2807512 RepID=A0A7M2WWK8_9BACT|nr:hypothetical protein [Humisphaera borealis]QOV89917.1 hypothetical protein IPV69_00660 [Humisphaera borealis]